MKIKGTKCDQCGKEQGIKTHTLEVRKIFSLEHPQLASNDPCSYYQAPIAELTLDFCSNDCLMAWTRTLALGQVG